VQQPGSEGRALTLCAVATVIAVAAVIAANAFGRAVERPTGRG